MNLRKFFTKLNNAIRPVHVAGDRGAEDRLAGLKNEAYVVGQQGTPTNIVSSQQDEKEHH